MGRIKVMNTIHAKFVDEQDFAHSITQVGKPENAVRRATVVLSTRLWFGNQAADVDDERREAVGEDDFVYLVEAEGG